MVEYWFKEGSYRILIFIGEMKSANKPITHYFQTHFSIIPIFQYSNFLNFPTIRRRIESCLL